MYYPNSGFQKEDYCKQIEMISFSRGEFLSHLQVVIVLMMVSVMMKQIMLFVLMMVETVVDTTSSQSIALNAHASIRRLA